MLRLNADGCCPRPTAVVFHPLRSSAHHSLHPVAALVAVAIEDHLSSSSIVPISSRHVASCCCAQTRPVAVHADGAASILIVVTITLSNILIAINILTLLLLSLLPYPVAWCCCTRKRPVAVAVAGTTPTVGMPLPLSLRRSSLQHSLPRDIVAHRRMDPGITGERQVTRC